MLLLYLLFLTSHSIASAETQMPLVEFPAALNRGGPDPGRAQVTFLMITGQYTTKVGARTALATLWTRLQCQHLLVSALRRRGAEVFLVFVGLALPVVGVGQMGNHAGDVGPEFRVLFVLLYPFFGVRFAVG